MKKQEIKIRKEIAQKDLKDVINELQKIQVRITNEEYGKDLSLFWDLKKTISKLRSSQTPLLKLSKGAMGLDY